MRNTFNRITRTCYVNIRSKASGNCDLARLYDTVMHPVFLYCCRSYRLPNVPYALLIIVYNPLQESWI